MFFLGGGRVVGRWARSDSIDSLASVLGGGASERNGMLRTDSERPKATSLVSREERQAGHTRGCTRGGGGRIDSNK